MVNSKFKKRILAIVAMLALLLSGVTAYSDSYSSVSAGMICGDVGSGMGRSSPSGSFMGAANEDGTNREWTAEELFRGSVGYSRFFGEREGDFIYKDTSERGKGIEGYEEVKDKLQADGGCGHLNIIPNFMIGTAEIVTGLTGSVILQLVGKDTMSETLSNIVGGEGDGDDGLIGSFFDSFYMPLVLIAVAIMAVTIIYKGLIQFKLREALGSIMWSVGAFIIGVALMLNPQLLAGIPQTATSTITTCVIGAISGQNCLSGNVETPSVLAGRECESSVANGNDSESVVNSLNCTIWKSFVLEPWAEVQYGETYDNLYTSGDIPNGGGTWSNMPEKNQANDYCVNFNSTKSYSKSKGSTIKMDGTKNEICNVALYHLFLKTDMTDPKSQSGNNFKKNDEYDKRWYHIAIPMANDTTKWRSWSGSSDFPARVSTSFMSLIAVIAASSVLLVLAVFGGAYKVVGTILIAFSPVFLLLAIEPTRGRRIFLGWLETLISSILKYFAITVLVVVALIMYAGLLSNTQGVTSLIGIIVLTVALHMYRKEIVDLIGASNMGGQRLSNKAAEVGDRAGRQFKEKSTAFVGGTIGGTAGNMLNRRSNVKSRKETIKDLKNKASNENLTDDERDFYAEEIAKEKQLNRKENGPPVLGAIPSALKGTLSGGGASFNRSMKRGTGLAANVFQQKDRTKDGLAANSRNKSEDDSNRVRREKFEAERTAREFAENPVGNDTDDPKVTNENGSEEVTNEVNIESEVSDEEFNIEIDKQRRENPQVKFDEDLSEPEKRELADLAKELREDSDEDLMRMLNDTELMEDVNKQKLVERELKIRLDANSNLGLPAGALAAASIATGGSSRGSSTPILSPKEIANFRELEEQIVNSHEGFQMNEHSIDEYKNEMDKAGFSVKEIEEAAGKLQSASNIFKQKERDRIDNNLVNAVKSGAISGDIIESDSEQEVVEGIYDDAINVVSKLGDESVNRKEFMNEMREEANVVIDEDTTEDLFKKMEMDGHIIAVSEGKDKRIAKTFESESVQPRGDEPVEIRRNDEPVEQIRTDEPTRRNADPDEPTRRSGEPVEPTRRNAEPDEPTRRNAEPDEPTRRNAEPDEPTRRNDEPVEPTRRNDEPDEPTRRNDEPVEPSRRNENPVEPTRRNDEPVEPVEPTRRNDEPVEPARRNDEPVESARRNDEHVEFRSDERPLESRRDDQPLESRKDNPRRDSAKADSRRQEGEMSFGDMIEEVTREDIPREREPDRGEDIERSRTNSEQITDELEGGRRFRNENMQTEREPEDLSKHTEDLDDEMLTSFHDDDDDDS